MKRPLRETTYMYKYDRSCVYVYVHVGQWDDAVQHILRCWLLNSRCHRLPHLIRLRPVVRIREKHKQKRGDKHQGRYQAQVPEFLRIGKYGTVYQGHRVTPLCFKQNRMEVE